MAARSRLRSWRTKLVLLLCFFSITPLLFLAYWTYTTVDTTFRTAALGSIEALASAKAEAVDQFTEDRVSDVERLATLLAPAVDELNAATTSAQEKAARRTPSPAPDPDQDPERDEEEVVPEELPDVKAIEGGASQAPPDEAAEPPPETAPEEAPEEPVRPRLEHARGELKRMLGLLLWDQNKFEELLIFDSQGGVVASTYSGHDGHTAASLEYFKKGRKATYVQPVFVSPITGKLTMVIATPIEDEQHQEIGVLAARLNLSRFFKLINDSTGLGKTGETVVAKKIDDELVLMAPTRHDDSAALQRTLPVGHARATALQEAASGRDGAGLQVDYRGITTLAAWRDVPSLGWGLLVKMDEAEAMKMSHELRRATMVLAGIIMLLAILAAIVAARQLVRPLRHLKEATDRISRGDFEVQLDIRSKDEIGELADSFERMVAAIKFFREHSRPEDDDDGDGDGDPDEVLDSEPAAQG